MGQFLSLPLHFLEADVRSAFLVSLQIGLVDCEDIASWASFSSDFTNPHQSIHSFMSTATHCVQTSPHTCLLGYLRRQSAAETPHIPPHPPTPHTNQPPHPPTTTSHLLDDQSGRSIEIADAVAQATDEPTSTSEATLLRLAHPTNDAAPP